jgi:hypothetical protein
MLRRALAFGSIFAIFSVAGCATKVITFKTGGRSKVSTVSPNNLGEDGTLLGETPLSIGVDKLQGKIVKITQPGKQPVYWIMSATSGDITEANINLLDDPSTTLGNAQDAAGKVDAKASTNRILRLLMKAYQALSGRRFKAARELADQAAVIDPELAAPHIVRGLSFYQEGDAANATTALTKAQALDPEDKEIESLLKIVR